MLMRQGCEQGVVPTGFVARGTAATTRRSGRGQVWEPTCYGPAPAEKPSTARGGFVAWDVPLFREDSHLGDAFVFAVVAHGTAHAARPGSQPTAREEDQGES